MKKQKKTMVINHRKDGSHLLGNTILNILNLFLKSSNGRSQLNDSTVCCRNLLLCIVANNLLVGKFDNLKRAKCKSRQ